MPPRPPRRVPGSPAAPPRRTRPACPRGDAGRHGAGRPPAGLKGLKRQVVSISEAYIQIYERSDISAERRRRREEAKGEAPRKPKDEDMMQE